MLDWSGFFEAEVGASAALAGLLFVGVSLNMSRILALKGLADRALEALVLLVVILLIASLQLVPGQPQLALGSETLLVGVVAWAVVTRLELRSLRAADKQYHRLYVNNMIVGQIAVIPYIVGGLTIIVLSSDGLYLVVPAMLVSFTDAILDAWVLLVEINR